MVSFILFAILYASPFTLHPSYAVSGINRTINFQGKLVDNNGLNVANGNYSVVFKLYDNDYNVNSGGTQLWTETQTVSVQDGIFRVALGSSTAIPANFNFNWDGIYLGIKVGSDAEMTPRVKMAAVPYAFNAEKVSGLTVQDENGNASTSGTLKVANGKTITFGNSFSTGTNAITITTSGSTDLSFGGSGSLQLVDTSTSQTLTNKIIGSTGLTFTGAATDVTTGSNEDLTLTPNGSGKLVLTSDFDSAVLIGSSTNTPAVLSVSGGLGSNAAFVLNQVNNGNLFVASQAGVTKFVIGNQGNVGIGTATPLSLLDVRGNTTGNAAMIVVQSTSSTDFDIFTASQGATTRFTIRNDGNVGIGTSRPGAALDVAGNVLVNNGGTIDTRAAGTLGIGTATQTGLTLGRSGQTTKLGSMATQWGVIYANATDGTLAQVAAGATGNCLNGNTGSAPTWGSCGAGGGGSNWWSLDTVNGVLYPGNLTTDFLIGGSSTISAKFAVLNISGSNTPIATIAGNFSLGSPVGTTRTIGATAMNRLQIGDASTGDVVLAPANTAAITVKNGGNVGIGTENPTAKLEISATSTQLALINGTRKSELFLDTSYVLNLGHDYSAGDNITQYNLKYYSVGGYGTQGLKLNDTGNGYQTVLSQLSDGKLYITDDLGNPGALVLGTRENPGDSSTFIASSGLWTISAGNLVLTNGAIQATKTTEQLRLRYDASNYNAFTVGNTGSLTIAATGTNPNITLTPGGTGYTILNGNVGVGTTTPTSLFDVRASTTGNAVATIVQSTSSTDFDIFTASQGATTRFVIRNDGNVGIGTSRPGASIDTTGSFLLGANSTIDVRASGSLTVGAGANTSSVVLGKSGATTKLGSMATQWGLIYANATDGTLAQVGAGATGNCLNGNTSAAPTWGSCGAGGGSSNWTLDTTNGILRPNNNVIDFLLGGTATVSAKFAVLNLNTGLTPVASIAGTFSLGSAAGTTRTIGATAMNSLQFGDSNTGSLLFSPRGSTAMTILSYGNVGIGTFAPASLLQVQGNTTGNAVATIVQSTASTDFDIFTASQGATTRFVIRNDGNVGIGTSRPGASIDTTGSLLLGANSTIDTRASGTITIGNGTNTTGLTLGKAATTLTFNPTSWTATPTISGLITATSGVSVAAGQSYTGAGAVTLSSTTNTLTLDSGNNILTVAASDTTIQRTAATDFTFDLVDGGTRVFTITNSGAGVAGLKVDGLNASNCDLKADTNGLFFCGTDATGTGGGGSSNWTLNNGVLRPNNNTLDILFGGVSTSSAKFAFMNINSNSGLDAVASFSGHLLLESMPDASNVAQTTWTQVSGTAGTIGGGATTIIASTSASAIYNGSLYVGTAKDAGGSAEVYRYNGTGTSWTKVSQATAGTLSAAGGATTNIGSVSAMTVFDGYLYAGTSKMNAAEVYRYDGGTTWTKVSSVTAGTIGGATPTANIDGIASMAVYQGRLYAGTREGGKAELYRYEGGTTWTRITNTAGTFIATNTVAVSAVTAMVVKNGVLYLGLQKTGDADVLRYNGGQGATATFLNMNLASATGSYNINGTAVTAFDEVTAMTVYNGNVIVGLRKVNGAEVLMMNDSAPATTTNVDTWTRLNNAAGQMTNGGTASIDMVTALTIYNGMLFIGTNEANNAEIYRYTGGDQKFFKVSQAAGTIASGGTPTIDAISFLQPTNGDLYAGTYELGRAEVYKYTAAIDRSYAVKFHSAPQMGGGEQSSVIQEASIYFVASASANLGSAAGNTGAIVFSHGIQTRNGSYDVAEDYPTRDDSLEPGDVVAIDPSERTFVKKAQGAYDEGTIGVYSEKPALRLTQEDLNIDGARAVPVALVGRVPVKVSAENGPIEPGDQLTLSSIPGVAMRATKAGTVIGKAMSRFAPGEKESQMGKVILYASTSSYQGKRLAEGLTPDGVQRDLSGVTLLSYFINSPEVQNQPTSEIVTDRLAAGLEVVTPKVTADELLINTIKPATGNNITIQLDPSCHPEQREGSQGDSSALPQNDKDCGRFVIKGENNEDVITFDSLGNATFKGLITADRIKANQIDGLDLLISNFKFQISNDQASSSASQELVDTLASHSAQIASLSDQIKQILALNTTGTALSSEFDKVLGASTSAMPKAASISLDDLASDGLATVPGNLRVKGNALVEGVLTVIDNITADRLIVNDLAHFFGDVVFKGNVTFVGRPVFNKDTAGRVLLKKDSEEVSVVFDKEYDALPSVNASISFDDQCEDVTDQKEQDKCKDDQKELEQKILDAKLTFMVTRRTQKGFVIKLSQKAPSDMPFSWTVLSTQKQEDKN